MTNIVEFRSWACGLLPGQLSSLPHDPVNPRSLFVILVMSSRSLHLVDQPFFMTVSPRLLSDDPDITIPGLRSHRIAIVITFSRQLRSLVAQMRHQFYDPSSTITGPRSFLNSDDRRNQNKI